MQIPDTLEKFFCNRFTTLMGTFYGSGKNRFKKQFEANFYFLQILFFFIGKQDFPAATVLKNIYYNLKVLESKFVKATSLTANREQISCPQ